MADPKRRLPGNVPGPFYVDARCIDCDACRQLAPEVFSAGGGQSIVTRQPATADEFRRAAQAVFACPTGSIGVMNYTGHKTLAGSRSDRPSDNPSSGQSAEVHLARTSDYRRAIDDFPLLLDEDVYYCGFNSEKSYGGNSYFVRHGGGNWLIDSPRYTRHLVNKFKDAGGIAFIFLTHRDDVADAAKYAREFNARHVIHRLELRAQPDAEIVVDGFDPVAIRPDFLLIPTPGHTRGHCCLLVQNRFLFTGDHLDWDRERQHLDASRDYCWYSWPQQVESVARLLNYSFAWVLPGHGQRVRLAEQTMRAEVTHLLAELALDRH